MQKFGLGTNIWTIPFENITKELEVILEFLILLHRFSSQNFAIVTLRSRSMLHGRRGSNTTIFPRLLSANIPDTTIPVDMLLFDGSLGLLWCLQHTGHDFPMHTCAVFLVWMDG